MDRFCFAWRLAMATAVLPSLLPSAAAAAPAPAPANASAHTESRPAAANASPASDAAVPAGQGAASAAAAPTPGAAQATTPPTLPAANVPAAAKPPGTAKDATGALGPDDDRADAIARDIALHPPQKPIAPHEAFHLDTRPFVLGSLLDRSVHGTENSEIGRVIDVLIGADGRPTALELDVGGFMGLGNRKIAVAWNLFDLSHPDGGAPLRVALSEAEVKSAPATDSPAKAVVVMGAESGAAPATPPIGTATPQTKSGTPATSPPASSSAPTPPPSATADAAAAAPTPSTSATTPATPAHPAPAATAPAPPHAPGH